ncbi:hypothetical protein BDC45DRAFT_424372, partial [Circinella umbellata]
TAYVRSVEKAQQLFCNPSNLIQGDYTDLPMFEKSISCHSRLFLIVHDSEIHVTPKYTVGLGEHAHAVDIFRKIVAFPYGRSFIGDASYKSKTDIAAISNHGILVTLRPSILMTH